MTHLKEQLVRMAGIDIIDSNDITIVGNGTYSEVKEIINANVSHPYTTGGEVETIKHRFSETYTIRKD